MTVPTTAAAHSRTERALVVCIARAGCVWPPETESSSKGTLAQRAFLDLRNPTSLGEVPPSKPVRLRQSFDAIERIDPRAAPLVKNGWLMVAMLPFAANGGAIVIFSSSYARKPHTSSFIISKTTVLVRMSRH